MSIFSRSRTPDEADKVRAAIAAESDAQGGQPKQPAKLTPPFVPPGAAGPRGATAPGVVPPPAAPIYSMRQPEPAQRVEGDAASSVAEKVSMAREALERAQVSLEGSVRVAAQRAVRTAASTATGVRKRPALRTAPVAPQAPRLRPRQSFDAVRAAQTGLLNLAWSWQQAGAPIRAIHAYMQVLSRYPDTPAADAAVADLVELSEKLAAMGQFHIALGIYDDLEELLA